MRFRSAWLAFISVWLLPLSPGCTDRKQHSETLPAKVGASRFRLAEVAKEVGLDFQWKPNSQRPLRILDTFGCGCAYLDYNQDGHLDIFLVGEPECGLFLNDGKGRFRNFTAASGLDRFHALWNGCAIGDYDGDSYPDVLLTGYRKLLLLRNERGKTLRDATAAVRLPGDNRNEWGSSAGFMDLDGDRDLDLVLLNYVVFNDQAPQLCDVARGIRSGCPPERYDPEFARLYRNNLGQFRDVTQASGLRDTHGKGLVLGFCDYDEDGRPDFYIGNDGTPAELMHNLGNLRFENAGLETGTAYGTVPGEAVASMGVDWGDFDRDGHLDFAVSAFENESYCLYHNEGGGFFRNVSREVGLTTESFPALGFGTNWLDVDNDGYPELFYANGHVYDNTDQITPGTTFRQPMMLFENREGRQLVNVAPQMGSVWTRGILGRGSARGDINGDGKTDLLVVDYEGTPLLLRNETESSNHWLEIAARGAGKNRLGYGLRATARAGDAVRVGEIAPSASYLSTSAPVVHFGLGSTTLLDTLTLKWPSGREQVLRNVEVDRTLVVNEPG